MFYLYTSNLIVLNSKETIDDSGKTDGKYQLIHSTSISQNANNPSNWSTEYSRSSSISSSSNFYPISLEDTDQDNESDTGVMISEYVSEDDLKAEVSNLDHPNAGQGSSRIGKNNNPCSAVSSSSSRPSWLEREMSERKRSQSQEQKSREQKLQSQELQQNYQNSPEMQEKRPSSRSGGVNQELKNLRRKTQEIIVTKQKAPARPIGYMQTRPEVLIPAASKTASTMSQSYPGSSISGSRSAISGGSDTEDDVLISDFEDKEKTPMAGGSGSTNNLLLSTNLTQYRQFVQERPPPAVAMARQGRRPSWEERVERLPTQPPRPASRGPGGTRRKTQEIILSQPPRPASRAAGGGSSAYFDDLGGRRGYELSRSPSETSTTSTIMSDMSSVSSRDRQSNNPKNTDPYKAGKCPHCYIHSWLPHSPQCPRKK